MGWKWFVATDEVDNVTPSEPSTEDIDYAVRVDGTVDVSITWNAIDYALPSTNKGSPVSLSIRIPDTVYLLPTFRLVYSTLSVYVVSSFACS